MVQCRTNNPESGGSRNVRHAGLPLGTDTADRPKYVCTLHLRQTSNINFRVMATVLTPNLRFDAME